GVGESDGATVERENGRLLEPALLLLSDEEPVILLVGVQVEIAELRIVPIGVEADRVEIVEPAVRVAREEETVRAGRLAKDDPPQAEVGKTRQEFELLEQVREIIGDQRVGVARCILQRLNERAVAAAVLELLGAGLQRGAVA